MSVLRKHDNEVTAHRLAVPSDHAALFRPNRFILSILAVCLLLLLPSTIFVGFMLIEGTLHHEFRSFPWPFLIFLMMLLSGVLYTSLVLFRHPCSLVFESSRGTIKLSGLIHSKTLQIQDMRGYVQSAAYLGKSSYPQRPLLILYFSNDEVFELHGFVVRDLEKLQLLLIKLGVPSLGEECSWYPFTKRKYKFTK